MKELKFPQPDKINPDALDDEIRAALGGKYVSLSTGEEIVIRATDEATAEEADAVEAIVKRHDPAKLSKREQFEAEHKAARARLEALDLSGKLDAAALSTCLSDMRIILLALDDFKRQLTRHE